MIEATVFIGAVIIGLTQGIKYLIPNITGWVTILVAIIVGVIVALTDQLIGVTDISVAQGLMIALASVGATTVASKIGVNTSPAPTK